MLSDQKPSTRRRLQARKSRERRLHSNFAIFDYNSRSYFLSTDRDSILVRIDANGRTAQFTPHLEVEKPLEDISLKKLPIKLPHPDRATFWFVWATIAAFGTYFCMYAFRKPFTAASFKVDELNGTAMESLLVSWGFIEQVDDHTWLLKSMFVTFQLIGYMLSKIIGIKVVSEMRPQFRAAAIVILILLAELCLLFFGLTSLYELKAIVLFLNGLMLGMIFGFVLGFLEGRRATEALTAGLCASFILAGGVAKSAGTWLVSDMGISEGWMPFTAGLLFLPALFIFVGMLACIPPPTVQDQEERTERVPLDGRGRLAFFWHNAPVLSTIILIFALVTVLRSVRDDYAPELWKSMGTDPDAGFFTYTEIFVAVVVLVLNGGAALIRDNQRAFFTALMTCIFGFALVLVTIIFQNAVIGASAFMFMVLVGMGLYLPYVAVHTTLFERWIAISKERSNLGFLMYVADSAGYLAYAGYLWLFSKYFVKDAILRQFSVITLITAVFSLIVLVSVCIYLVFRRRKVSTAWSPDSAIHPPQ